MNSASDFGQRFAAQTLALKNFFRGCKKTKKFTVKTKKMKAIISIVCILLSTMSNAQSNWNNKQDSLDFQNCLKILTELFEGRLVKNGRVQKNMIPSRYYWGSCCEEGTLNDHPKFEISYKNFLNSELRKNLNTANKSYRKETDENGLISITIGFDGVYTDGPRTGEQISYSIEFYKKEGIIHLYAIDMPSKLNE